MGCHHEMKSGLVVTVVNAGGLAGGCSFCHTDKVEGERDTFRHALLAIHNNAQIAMSASHDAATVQRLKKIIEIAEVAYDSPRPSGLAGGGRDNG